MTNLGDPSERTASTQLSRSASAHESRRIGLSGEGRVHWTGANIRRLVTVLLLAVGTLTVVVQCGWTAGRDITA